MAALVQTFPQQTGTVTMLQTRPSSTGMLPAGQPQSNQQYSASQQRNPYHGFSSGPGAPMVYRGSSTPIQPYAFTSTPSLNPAAPWQYGNYRASSASAVPTMQSFEGGHTVGRSRYPAHASMSNLPTTSSLGMGGVGGSRDDSALPVAGRRVATAPRPQSSYMAGSTSQVSFTQTSPVKAAPERYRRPAQPAGSAAPSGSGMANVNHLYNNGRGTPDSMARKQNMPPNRPNSVAYEPIPGAAADDIQLYRHHAQEEVKRFRRRSMPTLDSADYPIPLTPQDLRQPEESSRAEQLARPRSADRDQIKTARIVAVNGAAANAMHSRNGSAESLASSRSSSSRPSSSANRNTHVSIPTGNPAQLATAPDQNNSTQDYPKLVNIPPRSSSSDAAKRVTNPSPLSRPVTMESETDVSDVAPPKAVSPPAPQQPAAVPAASVESPAVRQLAAINQKGKAKSKTSRLRRAFSFGSAAELRKAGVTDPSAENGDASGPSKLHKEPTADELYDAEQARIAKQQEEAGLGNSIYAGAKIFTGSTDNLSISSTASSASIMIRKMGRGMKKGTRSLVGLFRPKSVVGVPAADGPVPDVSQPSVSMITVEAERERVNVNVDPHSQSGGGTGFPRLELNSLETSQAPASVSDRVGSSGTDTNSRKSIVGGEKERAEVLAAVRKGILKHSNGTSSAPSLDIPGIPQITDSPNSSAPSTPTEEVQGHKRTGSVAIGGEDYFMSALRLREGSKSSPSTPQGTLRRNATFSPRIVFYDTWPSQEYDRRGDIATCNRLTPMLAQQIKEELNTFKMEMEVHENSKIYTHFF